MSTLTLDLPVGYMGMSGQERTEVAIVDAVVMIWDRAQGLSMKPNQEYSLNGEPKIWLGSEFSICNHACHTVVIVRLPDSREGFLFTEDVPADQRDRIPFIYDLQRLSAWYVE